MYISVGVIGLLIGQFVDWCNIRLSEEKKVFSKDFFEELKNGFKVNYITSIFNMILYLGLFYKYGLSVEFLKYAFLASCLITVCIIDYHLEIIPNRLNLTIFEVGLIFTFVAGIKNLYYALDMIGGMFVGGGIFLLITLLGGLIAGKEAMGLGDVKLMGAMGLICGIKSIIIISILSFFVAAIVCIILIGSKKKTTKDYIPFGPSIVIAAYITLFVPANLLIGAFLWCISFGRIK